MSKIVLGIHCGYMHDSSAALIVDGEIRAVLLQERISRIKKDPYFPEASILKCLETVGISPKDVDVVSFAAKDIQYQPYKNSVEYFNSSGGYFTAEKRTKDITDFLSNTYINLKFKINRLLNNRPFDKLLRNKLTELGFKKDVDLFYYDHHDCHAASVYFTSGSIEAKDGFVFVIDSYGDGKSVSVYTFTEDNHFPVKFIEMPHWVSPGIIYSSATKYLGMKPNRHEGKVTGLAAYGNPDELYPKTEMYLRYNNIIRQFEIPCRKTLLVDKLIRRIKIILKIIEQGSNTVLGWMKKDFQNETKENIAAAVQKRFDVEITKFVKDIIGTKNPGCILLAGGIFANVRTNSIIGKMYPKSSIIIHPGMTDEGVGLGAALLADYKQNGNSYRRKLEHVYLGSNYDFNFVKEFVQNLDSTKYKIEEFVDSSAEGEKKIAQLINNGKVVGLFQGSMEYGPRALGNRSILADPRDRSVNDWLNKRLNRTEYMPFAPIVMKEYADDVFDINDNIRYTCNFMTITTEVKEKWRNKISGVVHIDNTARPQIIEKSINPVYYNIIDEFYKLTNIPLLINTSFNAHEEPILENPGNALESLNQNCVDYVYLYPYLISLKPD